MPMTATPDFIVRTIATNPHVDVASLVNEQVGPIMERLLNLRATNFPQTRAYISGVLEQIYAAVGHANIIHRNRIAALQLDAAGHRSIALAAVTLLDQAAKALDAHGDRHAANRLRENAKEFVDRLELDDLTTPNRKPYQS